MNKYKLIKEKGTNLKRIVALIDIPSINVKKGDKGGLIEKESNLSQEGDCWIGYYSKVFGDVEIDGDLQISHISPQVGYDVEIPNFDIPLRCLDFNSIFITKNGFSISGQFYKVKDMERLTEDKLKEMTSYVIEFYRQHRKTLLDLHKTRFGG